MQIILDIVIVVLIVDFVSGVLHWLEDSYGDPEWPVTGPLITGPNTLHHHRPAAFTRNSWLKSGQVLMFLGAVIIAAAWVGGVLTWQVLMFVAIGVNANEIHKWNHLPESKRGERICVCTPTATLPASRSRGR